MGLFIDGIFDDERMPLEGYIDIRLHFEDRNLIVTMPRDHKPYYAEYNAKYINTINQKNKGENE